MRVPYVVLTLEQAAACVDPDSPLFADTETCGFYQEIRLLQLMQDGWADVVLVEWPGAMEVASFLSAFDSKWHNAHYDITTIQQQTETRWVPKKFDCTFLLSRLAFPRHEKFSLDDVLMYTLGYDPYLKQNLDKKKLQKSKWDALKLSDDQLQYAATDVYFMPQLWDLVKDKLDTPSYRLDKSTLISCLDFQWNGMPVDKAQLFDVYEYNMARIKELAVPINVNSWQQVRAYLDCTESDDLALANMAAEGNTKAADLRETRKLKKQLSFLDKFETMDDRIYGKFKPSARSGRLTSNDQNLQQIPRALKKVFGTAPGRVLIYSDYAQLELRTICAIVDCILMASLFREGEDLHGYTAKMVFGEDWTKEHRQISKTYNFNLLYGGGVTMILTILLKTVGIRQDEAKTNKDRAKWRNLWREIYAWQERGIASWKKGRLGSTPMGREYKAKMMTDQLNIENQGAGAEVAKLALHYLKPDLDKYSADVKLCNFIHDSFIIEAPDDPAIYQPIAISVAERMQEAWFEMSRLFKIKDLPMPVDVKVGTNWGDIEDDNVANIWDYTLEPYAVLEKVNAKV